MFGAYGATIGGNTHALRNRTDNTHRLSIVVQIVANFGDTESSIVEHHLIHAHSRGLDALSASVYGRKAVNKHDAEFHGDIAVLYDRHFVPLLFDGYAADLAARIQARHPRHILEVAAGSGALTRAILTQCRSDVDIVATDLNQAMLDVAMTKSSARNVSWKQADALALPFDRARFDLVACQFGVMFFPDKVKAYREVLRVLEPSGTFLFNSWGSLDENPITRTVSDTLAAIFPDNPPRFMERTPHGYHSLERITADLNEAGFGNVAIEKVCMTARSSSIRDVAIAFCRGTPWKSEIAANTPTDEKVVDAVTTALERFSGGGALEGEIVAYVVSAEPGTGPGS